VEGRKPMTIAIGDQFSFSKFFIWIVINYVVFDTAGIDCKFFLVI